MKNEAITGWRVRNRTRSGCHVPDSSPDGYYSVPIPVGAIGTLTGDISAYFNGIDEQECRLFMIDAERIRQALTREILLDLEEAVKRNLTYWQETADFQGEDLLASRTALVIKWDCIYEQEPATINCASYIPWLELLE